MAEVRKFSQESDDELQKLVRQQIGDTVLPTPPGREEKVVPQAETTEQPSAATDFVPASSYLFYGELPAQPQTPSPEAEPER